MSKDPSLRIMFFGRYTEGSTGIVRSIFMGLHELGHTIYEINVTARPRLLFNPYRRQGGHGPIYIRWELVKEEIEIFKPDVIIFCAGGLTFEPEVIKRLKKRYTVVAFTLSDPDVFPTISQYASLFDYHTTNSVKALELYKQKGINNTILMPFAIDSRFFVPRSIDSKFKSDVSIIGHARENRINTVKRLIKEFDAKVYGRNWPFKSLGPVYGEEWFKAAYSSNILINFPKTGAGYTNVKVGVFEAIATGRLLFTEYFDEMKMFYEYDKEIIGYRNEEDLISKVRYYINHKEEAEIIAKAGQIRTASEHTWKKRLADFFDEVGIY
ncbi:CgeB family protein [Priestia sp. RMT2NF4]|uniref:CgeB family protein n=1 Tax=Priestia sp. RMT2NF4 TaxID=3398394 RepID=UPI003A4C64DA